MNGFRIFLILIALSLILPDSSWAVHKGAGELVCGSCHTMHNSQGRSQLNTLTGPVEGSIILLRGPVLDGRADIHRFCLQCHSDQGSQANVLQQPHGEKAPKVHSVSLGWDESKSFGEIGAGGNFYPEIDENFDRELSHPGGGSGEDVAVGKGHSLGLTNVKPPGFNLPWGIDYISCTKCHNPHGTDTTMRTEPLPNNNIHIFRNLRGGEGGGDIPGDNFTSWVGGITGRFDSGGNYVPMEVNGVAIWPVYRNNDPTIKANNNSYDGTGYPNSMASWCAMCHISWHENQEPINISGEDWTRHPVEKVISDSDISGAGVDTIDWTHYNGIADGFKLPAANTEVPLGTGAFYYANGNNTDKVFCFSCHFAHGGPYYDNLRWDYLAAVEAGSQTAKAIPSNKGCQQCHYR